MRDKNMNSPKFHALQGLAWPRNGAKWIEHELLVGPGDRGAHYSLVDASRDDDGDDVEWKITIGDDSLKIERREGAVAHLPREIRFEDFSEVVLWGALAHTENADVMVGLSLYSAEHDVQVPICIQSEVDGLAQHWTAWSVALGIPPKVLDAGERLRDPFHGMGRIMHGVAGPRRLPSRRLDRGAYMPSSTWRREAEVHVRSN
jgi:hypothetical protein